VKLVCVVAAVLSLSLASCLTLEPPRGESHHATQDRDTPSDGDHANGHDDPGDAHRP